MPRDRDVERDEELETLQERVERWLAAAQRGPLIEEGGETGTRARQDHLALAVREGLMLALEELRVRDESLEAAFGVTERELLRCRRLFERAPVALLVTDTQGRIRDANVRACSLLGREPPRLAGVALSRFVPLLERRAFRSALAAVCGDAGRRELPLHIGPAADEVVPVRALLERCEETGRDRVVYWSFHEDWAGELGELL